MVQRNLTWGNATFRGLFGVVLAIAALDTLILLDGLVRWATVASLAVFSVAMIATAASGYCPIYHLAGRTTALTNQGWDE